MLSDYDLIVPSISGFAFSALPAEGYASNAVTADLWHTLMTDVLGYREYAAGGGDMGRGIVCYMAARHPEAVRGIHLTDVGLVRELISAPDTALSEEERRYKHAAADWPQLEGAYMNIHSTKPQTAAYFLSDSPAGMAAWITEKYWAWSDRTLLKPDDILDSLTLSWMTNSAGTSVRAYRANTFMLLPMGTITVPTAAAVFPHNILPVPRAWVEEHYPLVMYSHMKKGGHFTALEDPEAFAQNLSVFIEKIR